MKKQFNKIWLLSPIILTGILVLLSLIFNWRDLNLGFQMTPSMLPHLGQTASVKLDVTLPQEFILMGNLDIAIKSGAQFEMWISPFLLNFAEIKTKNNKIFLRSIYVESQKELMEAITIILPKEIPDHLSLTISGNSQLHLSDLIINNLTLDLLGNQFVSLNYVPINHLDLYTKGIAEIISTESLIQHLNIHNMGRLQANLTLADSDKIHKIKSWGNAKLLILSNAKIRLNGMGNLAINQQIWENIFNENVTLQ